MSSSGLTMDLVIRHLEEATEIGTIAANKRIEELSRKHVADGKLLEPCGGSILKLEVDGRSSLGKLLGKLPDEYRFRKSYGSGYAISLEYNLKKIPPVNGQEYSISLAGDEAAAKYIMECLGIQAYASSYDS